MRTAVTGFILAGGKSSRMGRDKASLPFGNKTLAEQVVQRVRPSVDRLILIGRPENVEGLRCLAGVDAVWVDAKPDQGPLMGIYTGLCHTRTALNLFLPCDMPWVAEPLLRRIVQSLLEGAEVVASWHPLEGIQPFPLGCRRKALAIVERLLAEQERSLKALFHLPLTRLVRIEEPSLWRSFTNVNTVEAYAELCRETTHPSG